MDTFRKAVLLSLLVGMVIVSGGCPRPDPDAIIDGIEFVWCPSGTFDMGCRIALGDCQLAALPRHEVVFSSGFWISKYEITNLEWWAVMGERHGFDDGNNHPVDNVSWNDAQEFVATLNAHRPDTAYRLPSEAQWEYACRAGATTRYYWGDDPDQTEMDDYAWIPLNSGDESHTVGTRLPNAWGIYDMSGNVWEWTQDRFHGSYIGAPDDGSAWEDGDDTRRVVRGGSFYNDEGCRSDFRAGMPVTDRYGDYGLRLVIIPEV